MPAMGALVTLPGGLFSKQKDKKMLTKMDLNFLPSSANIRQQFSPLKVLDLKFVIEGLERRGSLQRMCNPPQWSASLRLKKTKSLTWFCVDNARVILSTPRYAELERVLSDSETAFYREKYGELLEILRRESEERVRLKQMSEWRWNTVNTPGEAEKEAAWTLVRMSHGEGLRERL